MKKRRFLICFGLFVGLMMFIGGCIVAPPYEERGVYYQAPDNVVIHDPPVFINPPSLGFYAAIGIPYDLFYLDRSYYLYHDNHWYRSPRYNGPWGAIKNDALPGALRHHRYEEIIRDRESEHRAYREERDRYRGKSFRPERDEPPDRGGQHGDHHERY